MIIIKSAVISDCGCYRYVLRREWNDDLPPMLILMLNPSKADAERDDPTITRSIHRAKLEGCGSLVVGNAGAGRATYPKDWAAMEDPYGPDNRYHIRRLLIECWLDEGKAVVAWGTLGHDKAGYILDIAKVVGIKLWCLGKTKAGDPRHPLYMPYDKRLEPYP